MLRSGYTGAVQLIDSYGHVTTVIEGCYKAGWRLIGVWYAAVHPSLVHHPDHFTHRQITKFDLSLSRMDLKSCPRLYLDAQLHHNSSIKLASIENYVRKQSQEYEPNINQNIKERH